MANKKKKKKVVKSKNLKKKRNQKKRVSKNAALIEKNKVSAVEKNNVSENKEDSKKKLSNKTNNKKNQTKKVSKNKSSKNKNKTKKVSEKKTESKKIKSTTKSIVLLKDSKENAIDKKDDLETKVKKRNIKINKAKLRKAFIILFVILCLTLIVIFYKMMKDKGDSSNIEFEKITIKEYFDLYSSKELQYIYLTNKSCMDCKSYEININKLQAEYKINIKKLDFTNISDDNLEKLKTSHSHLKDGIEVPMLISIKDGKEVTQVSGIKEYSVLKKFVDYSINPTDTNSFEKITLDKYLSLIKAKDTTLIYIGDSTNNGCKKFAPVLEEVSNSRKVKVHYLNTNNFSKEEEWEKLENSSDIFKKQWFMPTVIIVKNGKIKDYKMEILSKKDLEKFFKKNNL